MLGKNPLPLLLYDFHFSYNIYKDQEKNYRYSSFHHLQSYNKLNLYEQDNEV